MTPTYDKYERFEKALQAWLLTSAQIVSLTGYDASTNISVFVSSGEDPIDNPPLLVIDDLPTENFFQSVDTMKISMVHLSAYAKDRLTVIRLLGAVEALAAQNDTTYRDASFASFQIKTETLKSMGLDNKPGDATLGITVAHRAQVPITNFHTGGVVLEIVWQETS